MELEVDRRPFSGLFFSFSFTPLLYVYISIYFFHVDQVGRVQNVFQVYNNNNIFLQVIHEKKAFREIYNS